MASRLFSAEIGTEVALGPEQFVKTLCLLSTAACVLLSQSVQDPLPRRGYFGVGLEASGAGVRVSSVAPASTALSAGIAVGDIIAAVDGRAPATPDAVVATIGRHRAGDNVAIQIVRNGERPTVSAQLKALPAEQMPNAAVHYASVEALPGVRLRTIISVPTAARARFPQCCSCKAEVADRSTLPLGRPSRSPA